MQTKMSTKNHLLRAERKMNMKANKKLVAQAFERTEQILPEYWASVLDQRFENGERRAGSFFTGLDSKEEIPKKILSLPDENFSIFEGSPIEGKAVFRVTGIKGKEGVIEKEKVDEKDIFFDNPKNIPGRQEYCTFIDCDDHLPDTDEIYIPVLYQNPDTKAITPNEPFVPTILVGRYLGPDDTVKGVGSFVKLEKRK